MQKYYTRACNFYYGRKSVEKVLNKSALPLNDNNLISFDSIEIISRKNIKRINFNNVISMDIIMNIHRGHGCPDGYWHA